MDCKRIRQVAAALTPLSQIATGTQAVALCRLAEDDELPYLARVLDDHPHRAEFVPLRPREVGG